MEHFTPFASLIGGMLIGLSATMLLLCDGKIAGISGIVAGMLSPTKHDTLWRVVFVAGLLTGGFLLRLFSPQTFAINIARAWGALLLAGLLVGFGTRLGNGCTSGHGVCGLSRFSPRSLIATITFTATGAATVYIINHFLGGTL
ncbi:MAG TPA: YeeE/YedE family protein [Candidatus Binatia bacterium]|nr:YeeE/YedE family protein [Candidatus Binatia bacterium]